LIRGGDLTRSRGRAQPALDVRVGRERELRWDGDHERAALSFPEVDVFSLAETTSSPRPVEPW